MAEQPSQQQSPPPVPPNPTQAQAGQLAGLLVAAGIAAGTAATLVAGATAAAGGVAGIVALLARWGYDPRAVRAVVRMVTTTTRVSVPPAISPPTAGGPVSPPPPAPESPAGEDTMLPPAPRRPAVRPFPAVDRTDVFGRQTARERNAEADPVYRAWFILNTARRIMQRRRLGKEWTDAIRPERTYLEQHERARRARFAAAAAVDAEASKPGTLEVNGRRVLVWRAHDDDKTTWECVAADGRWFYADRPPIIGYPGMPHGGTCRCWPAQATPAALRGDMVDTAVRSAQGTADHPAERFPQTPGEREAS